MTRPQIIRADTIDLQDADSPSAKDHTRQPTHPSPLGSGPPSPHQASELKRAGEFYVGERNHSPRVSQDFDNPEYQNGANVLSNGVVTENVYRDHDDGAQQEDLDNSDGEGDDGLDDDMLDKMSSSPSIDDGGYLFPFNWPQRTDSLATPPRSPLLGLEQAPSSSPFVDSPAHLPLGLRGPILSPYFPVEPGHEDLRPLPEIVRDSLGSDDSMADERKDKLSPLFSDFIARSYDSIDSLEPDGYRADPGTSRPPTPQLHDLLLPSADPLLQKLSEAVSTMSPADKEPSLPFDEAVDLEDSDSDSVSSTDGQFSFVDRDQLVDSGWGGECLQETEDIDFEFVYALRTFVATVEGQANATKGDTMVLLDDSNSYWWLVRVVKDSSIGYLPAEHIETPTERLARLNKHRNIDLSATQLSDNAEKSKNPLKKAMRRRNAKTVQFAAPTYHEASDIDYSTDEEDEEGNMIQQGQRSHLDTDGNSSDEGDQITAVEPLKVRSSNKAVKPDGVNGGQSRDLQAEGKNAAESSDLEDMDEPGSKERRSKNGTVRNTDSFFRDETVETRKISLTPKLLSDDSNGGSPVKANEPKEVPRGNSAILGNSTLTDAQALKTRASFDSQEKVLASEKPKEEKDKKKADKKDKKEKEKKEKEKDKKDKEKKPGVLSGFFKRNKDKRPRQTKETDDDDDSLAEKTSVDSSRASPVSKASEESSPLEAQAPSSLQSQNTTQAPARQPSKLQKPAPLDLSATKRAHQGSPAPEPQLQTQAQLAPPDRPAPTHEPAPTTIRGISPLPESRAAEPSKPAPSASRELELAETQFDAEQAESRREHQQQQQHTGILAPITNILKIGSTQPAEPKPEKVKRAKHRVELDDFDSSSADDEHHPLGAGTHRSGPTAGIVTAAPPTSHPSISKPPQTDPFRDPTDRLSESPVHITHPSTHSPSSTSQISPPSTPSPTALSPTLSPISTTLTNPHQTTNPTARPTTPSTTTPSSTTTPTASWSNASLRAYFDDEAADARVRDLLIVVHDKSGVVPVARDHPLLGGLEKERKRLGEMEGKLDRLVVGWLESRGR
ncbi:MAG: hypothetical protein M1814_003853 [Vezdaea aestivalis]|nr:MAG: hypothetical protein M1814_003853 [Vezdaea aestivalis]